MRMAAVVASLLPISCAERDAIGWANRDEIIAAAAHCGVAEFQPTRADARWAAYVDHRTPDWKKKEDCIYETLRSQNLLVTR